MAGLTGNFVCLSPFSEEKDEDEPNGGPNGNDFHMSPCVAFDIADEGLSGL